jgi:hypothetical protein
MHLPDVPLALRGSWRLSGNENAHGYLQGKAVSGSVTLQPAIAIILTATTSCCHWRPRCKHVN